MRSENDFLPTMIADKPLLLAAQVAGLKALQPFIHPNSGHFVAHFSPYWKPTLRWKMFLVNRKWIQINPSVLLRTLC